MADRKKERELRHFEEARRASPLFPPGMFLHRDSPDFWPVDPTSMPAVEHTELCREGPLSEAGRLEKVARRAKAQFTKRRSTTHLHVSAVFANDVSHLTVTELAASLEAFVYEHRNAYGDYSRNLPDGYSYVGVYPLSD